ncbi:MAG: hypothetical protein MI747_14880 [Desulfobacterales bacterium]|nr:hypothetical protein [Desulfobacterales bacterium]
MEHNQAVSMNTQLKKGLTAGIFIGDQHISLALVGREKMSSPPKVIKWNHNPLPTGVGIGHPEFHLHLKETVTRFLRNHKNTSLWTCLDAGHLKLRPIEIPELRESKIYNAAFWGLKNKVEFEESTELFDYQVLGKLQRDGVQKMNILAYAGDKNRIDLIQSVFTRAGLNLKGITAFPFAIQNFMRNKNPELDTTTTSAAVVHIDRNHSDISCFSNGNILLSRHIRTGVSNLLQEYQDYQTDSPGPEISQELNFLSTLTSSADANFQLMSQSAQRLTGRISATGDYFNHHLSPDTPIGTYFLSGELDDCQAFKEFAEEQLQGKIKKFLPFNEIGETLNIRMPQTPSQRTGVIPAMGIALSTPKETPNFLYTHVEKEVEKKNRKRDFIISGAFLLCLAMCIGVWTEFRQESLDNQRQIQKLENQLAQFVPSVTPDILTAQIQKARDKTNAMTQYAKDYLPLAVVGEISNLTPDKVRITHLDARLAPPQPDKKIKSTSPAQPNLMIQGVVVDQFNNLESTLTDYVIKLGDSPLFKNIQLSQKKIEKTGDTSFLAFTAEMEIH